MCIGIPMRVVSVEGGMAVCEGRDGRERVNVLLIDEPSAGTWVLAHQGSAIRILTAEEAAQTVAAHSALAAILAGAGNIDAHFADLVNREPELPAHLRGQRR